MRNYFFFLFFVAANGFAQFEQPKKTLRIAPVTNTSGVVAPASPKSITYPSIFDKKDKLLEGVSLLNKKPEQEQGVMEVPKIESGAKEYTDKMNEQLKAEGLTSVVENRDFFFGEFTILTETLYIACRDYGAIDGDNVSIWLNGEKVIPAIYLESGFKKYTFKVKEGLNIIQIEALNTGELFPNTGQFTFFDGNQKLITNQSWVLNTGYKAIVRINKIKGIEEKK